MREPIYATGSDEWVAQRRSAICATDAAAAFGLSRWMTRYALYLDKTNQLAAKLQTRAMLWGSILEVPIGRQWSVETGKRVRHSRRFVRLPGRSYVATHLDFEVVDENAGLEIKTGNEFAKSEWGEPGSDQIPGEYGLQVQHEMLVMGWDRCYVYALLGGNDDRQYVVERDEKAHELMLTCYDDLWLNNVVPHVPPAIDGSEEATAYLQAQYPHDNGEEIAADELWTGLLQDHVRLTAEIAERQKAKDELGNRIREHMGPATYLRGGFVSASYKLQKGCDYTVHKEPSRVLRVTAKED